jgi:PAS domain S-box-containing protein
VEQSPDAIAVHRGGAILYVNSASLRLVGMEERERVVGRSILHFIHPADHRRARQRLSMSSAQRSSEPIELRLCRADGTTVAVEATSVDVHFDESDASQVVLRDITLRKHLEEDARELIREQAARAAAEAAERRARFLAEAGAILGSSLDYRTTLRSVARLATASLADSCIVFVVEDAGEIQHIETAHADPGKEAVLRELVTRDPPNPQSPRSPSARVLRTGEAEIIVQTSEDWLLATAAEPEQLALSRQVMPRSLMCVPLIGRGRVLGAISFGTETQGQSFGPEDLVLAQELATRAALAIDNARLYYEAQQASRAKSEFMAVMSHELKNPLTAVTTYAELLRDEVVGPLSLVQKQQLDVISANSFHLARLIDEVLAYTRSETERIEVRRERIETGTLARQVVEWVRPMAEAKGLALVLRLPPEPAVVETDATRLRQIVVNLLTNAVRFTDQGSIELAVEEGEGKVWVRVADTGIGIAPEHREKIFEPFWQVDHSYTRRAGGTGLGLSVVQRLSRLLGGDVAVRSAPGQGSTFSVWLPLAPT